MSPKSHSTDVRTALIDVLKFCMGCVIKRHSGKELEGKHEEDKLGHHIGTSVDQWGKRHTAEDQQVAQNLLAYLHHVFFFLKRKRENCHILITFNTQKGRTKQTGGQTEKGTDRDREERIYLEHK